MNNKRSSSILVVDDSKFNRAVILKTLKEIKMDITTASNGEEALELYTRKNFDLLITDTVMPKMDGITLIKEIKQLNKPDFTPIILMTGNDDANIKITGLNIGADDFLSKPIDQKELVARVFSLLRLKKMHDLLYEKNNLIEKELEVAKKIQHHIIPNNFSYIEYPKVFGYYLPMEDIGGDFFDCYNLPNGCKGFLISDVTGHGIPAALIVTMTKMMFATYASKYMSTKQLFYRLNNDIAGSLMDDQYITSLYCIYDSVSGKIKFSNAGHVRPLLYKKKKNKVYELSNEDGFFLGIVENCTYDQKAVKVEEGDRLFMYTDGLTELKDLNRKEFGESRLRQFLVDYSSLDGNEFCSKLIETVINHSYKKQRSDDIAYLYIQF